MSWRVLIFFVSGLCAGAQLPDISTVPLDLQMPPLVDGHPGPGKRCKGLLKGYPDSAHHVLYLPRDWRPDCTYPVLVEFAGNGPYQNRFGDVTTGRVEGSKMGYGISGGEGYLWLCLPYLDNTGRTNVTKWWGTAPTYDPRPTIEYCLRAVSEVCRRYNGDTNRVVLCGFSRGAIACNFIGLHDDCIAGLWRAFVPYSHYDGVRTGWPYPGSDRKNALRRLQRLGTRPQFICGEGNNAKDTERYLNAVGERGSFTIRGTGFRNHNDAWLLRPSPVRTELREWLKRVLQDSLQPK